MSMKPRSLGERPHQAVLDLIAKTEGWHVMRIAAGLVLLTAAATKCYQYSVDAPLYTWPAILLIEAEWLGSLVLLCGVLPRVSWIAAVLVFSAFSLVSLWNGLVGHESCGCFGHWEVNPFVMTAFDALLVAGLLYWRPTTMHDARLFMPHRILASILTVWLVVGIPAAYAMSSRLESTLSDLGEQTTDGKTIVLLQDKWFGRRFPLLDYIDIGATLEQGKWLVLIYRHGCPKMPRDAL